MGFDLIFTAMGILLLADSLSSKRRPAQTQSCSRMLEEKCRPRIR